MKLNEHTTAIVFSIGRFGMGFSTHPEEVL